MATRVSELISGERGPEPEQVTRVRIAPDGTESRQEVEAVFEDWEVSFKITEDIEEGDLLDRPLPNGKVQTVRLMNLTYHQRPSIDLAAPPKGRIHAEFVNDTPHPKVSQRKVTLPGLHPGISGAAGALYEDRHYSNAIRAAFQAVEARVQQLTGNNEIGQKLMGDAFKPGALDVTTSVGANLDSERDGFKLLFMGAMSGLRNPRSHGIDVPVSAEEALESLAFASLLMRRLDLAEERLNPTTP